MTEVNVLLDQLAQEYQSLYREQQVIMSFDTYLDKLKSNPLGLTRNAAAYLKDTFDHFGLRDELGGAQGTVRRFQLFDQPTEKSGPIVGGEGVQGSIYNILDTFVRQGFVNRLILLHGPNGSSKTSTLDTIAHAMNVYSQCEEGAVYRFNWVFPTEKTDGSRSLGETGTIGFGGRTDPIVPGGESFAMLDESKILSRIQSEFKDNPLYLVPQDQREKWLREWIGRQTNTAPEDVEIPPHALYSGLSKKNQLILENLLTGYGGDYSKVLRHVQVERFYYSKQYRVGVASVEPRMSIDAIEKQLTMDSNIQNLPPVLNNIRFFEAGGPLIEANRGILEFSDMLKRPVEAFKYLLTTVEKANVDLPSSTANLDIVFFATTNEKHLDAFKTIPDFTSFRSRFELVTVPYLLQPSKEVQIYENDIRVIAKKKKVAPHSLNLLCTWAVMTRLKQPDPVYYESQDRSLISRLDPRRKVALYEKDSMQPYFKPGEEARLQELSGKVAGESQDVVIYEGRFGASPREVRAILYRAIQNPDHETLTPMTIFEELTRLVRDRTVYEFLQFEQRGKYHDTQAFIGEIRNDFARIFESEVLAAMDLVEDKEYHSLLDRYVENVVASVKKEKIFNPASSSYQEPSSALMQEVEKILGVTGSPDRHREGILGKIAAFRIEHKDEDIDLGRIFHEFMRKIRDHYHGEKSKVVDKNFKAMLTLGSEEEKDLKDDEVELAKGTFARLSDRFGYDEISARESLKFLVNFKNSQSKK